MSLKYTTFVLLVVVQVLMYMIGYYRGAKVAQEAITEAKSAVEGWTTCLQDLDHCQKLAKEAIELCRKKKQ